MEILAKLIWNFTDGGYDIQDFYEVNSMFGTNEDLDNLFTAAKDLGLKIILDFVSWRLNRVEFIA